MKTLDKMGVLKDECAQQWKNATVVMNALSSCIDYINEMEKLNQEGNVITMKQKVKCFAAVSSFDACGLTGQLIRDIII